MHKINVLHIYPGPGGGISALLQNLLAHTNQWIDHTMMTVSLDGGELFVKRIETLGGKHILIPRPRTDGLLSFFQSIDKVLREGHYDAIHSHIDGWRIVPIRLLALKYHIRTFIVHAHKTLHDGMIDRTFIGLNLNRFCNCLFATEYMTCSQLAADYVFGKFYQKYREAYLIPNGMSDDIFCEKLTIEERNKYSQEFSVCSGDVVIGHVGRLNHQKNHPFILKMASALKMHGKKFKIIIVGDGELKDQIMSMISKMELREVVVLTGQRSDISKLMQFFDLMILPSPREGLPTVAVECQASGTPMFISNTITSQCDMGLGLLKFIPLELEKWMDAIEKYHPWRLPIDDCLKLIRDKGFTAKEAGRIYAGHIERMIKKQQ